MVYLFVLFLVHASCSTQLQQGQHNPSDEEIRTALWSFLRGHHLTETLFDQYNWTAPDGFFETTESQNEDVVMLYSDLEFDPYPDSSNSCGADIDCDPHHPVPYYVIETASPLDDCKARLLDLYQNEFICGANMLVAGDQSSGDTNYCVCLRFGLDMDSVTASVNGRASIYVADVDIVTTTSVAPTEIVLSMNPTTESTPETEKQAYFYVHLIMVVACGVFFLMCNLLARCNNIKSTAEKEPEITTSLPSLEGVEVLSSDDNDWSMYYNDSITINIDESAISTTVE